MDRFIVNAEVIGESAVVDLKSNMDRFIGVLLTTWLLKSLI